VPVDGGEIPVRVVHPASVSKDETFPLVVYIHGGGAVSFTASRSAGAGTALSIVQVFGREISNSVTTGCAT
jgi:acetyl esterase/lipase